MQESTLQARDDGILSPKREAELLGQISVLKEENDDLKQQLANLKKALYGQKSEKTEVILEVGEQMRIFNEAEDLQVRDELVYVPARLFVRKHYAEVLKCPACGEDETVDANYADVTAPVFRKADVPAPMIPHSFCSPELLAHILYEKYVKAVPLERQAKDLKAMGIILSTATLSNWVIRAAEDFFMPVYAQMKMTLLCCPVIHADETVVQVLNEPNRKAKTQSRMWVYCAGKHEVHSNILFEYRPTRSGENAQRFLNGYSGCVVCDGFDGYNKLIEAMRCGCWAHARRKFVEALPTEEALLAISAAAKGVEYCNKLFCLEREFEGKDDKGRQIKEPLSAEERKKQRQERSRPVLDAFFAWLSELNPSGGTKLAKATQYCLNEKTYLYRFLEDGNIPIDNNRAENAIRPFVVGRKNWLFANTPKGAETSAVIYSLAATATANGLNVEEYFTDLCKGQTLLPWKKGQHNESQA